MFNSKEEIIKMYLYDVYTSDILKKISKKGSKAAEENDPLVNDIDKWFFVYAGRAAEFYSSKAKSKQVRMTKHDKSETDPRLALITDHIIISVMNDLNNSVFRQINYGQLKKHLAAALFFVYKSIFMEEGAVRGWYLDENNAEIILYFKEFGDPVALNTVDMAERVVKEALVVYKNGDKNTAAVDGKKISEIAFDIIETKKAPHSNAYTISVTDEGEMILKEPLNE